ncbi:MAG: chromate transporter [Clostridiales bacterium]|uniref:chromate transporter n=1 Tax=Terrisporobacter sp. TaxID=1965305 RepID=UPI002A41F4D1|nr:chromate transporter [Terrisporobacter sp.]MCI6458513.1 chromate transporter [Clostridium sp.]MDD5878909.1 chromate transporter [Clostridiales bacterium]MCI7205411.1 chromate transporter [Clostridium sp.]MDD7754613.1 chromate transporter [Clostridiales bacterium]MDY4134148.1 chromate transporter [Terrisporobacter sp.]
MIYLQLFFEFFKTGLFAVGGGMATLPFLYDMAEKTNWFTSGQLADMIAVSESTPGPIGVNMATYVGFTTAGFWGGLIATLALVTPSVIIIVIISYFLKAFRENKYVDAAFYGLRPASTGLIAAAGMTVVTITLLQMDLFKNSGSIMDLFNWKSLILAVIIYILSNNIKQTKKLHPVFFIVGSAIIGILFGFAGV